MITKKSREKYLFDINNYEIIGNINKGGFGIINLVREKNKRKIRNKNEFNSSWKTK